MVGLVWKGWVSDAHARGDLSSRTNSSIRQVGKTEWRKLKKYLLVEVSYGIKSTQNLIDFRDVTIEKNYASLLTDVTVGDVRFKIRLGEVG